MEHAPQHERGELVAFQWRFNSLQFSPDWLLAELEGARRRCGNRKDASRVVERLAQFSETSSFQAVAVVLPDFFGEKKGETYLICCS